VIRKIRRWLAMAGVLVAAIVLSELPPLQRLDRAISSHAPLLLGLAITLTVVGFSLFMGGIIAMLMAGGEEMSHEDVEESSRSIRDAASGPRVWRVSAYRITGRTEGRQVANETTFAGMKDAWRSGDWSRDPQWRRLFIIAAGVAMLCYGMFGIFVVTGPAYLKLLLMAALLYATIAAASGFARA
jgi:hypothetical protein